MAIETKNITFYWSLSNIKIWFMPLDTKPLDVQQFMGYIQLAVDRSSELFLENNMETINADKKCWTLDSDAVISFWYADTRYATRWTLTETWYIFELACRPSIFLMVFPCIFLPWLHLCVRNTLTNKTRKNWAGKKFSGTHKKSPFFPYIRFIDILYRAFAVWRSDEEWCEMDKFRDNWTHSNISHLILWLSLYFLSLAKSQFGRK